MTSQIPVSNLILADSQPIVSQEIIKEIILQPVMMTIPNSFGIYCPSQLKSQKRIDYQEFLAKYAQYPRNIKICFVKDATWADLEQKSEWVTAYSFGLNCWYIISNDEVIQN